MHVLWDSFMMQLSQRKPVPADFGVETKPCGYSLLSGALNWAARAHASSSFPAKTQETISRLIHFGNHSSFQQDRWQWRTYYFSNSWPGHSFDTQESEFKALSPRLYMDCTDFYSSICAAWAAFWIDVASYRVVLVWLHAQLSSCVLYVYQSLCVAHYCHAPCKL